MGFTGFRGMWAVRVGALGSYGFERQVIAGVSSEGRVRSQTGLGLQQARGVLLYLLQCSSRLTESSCHGSMQWPCYTPIGQFAKHVVPVLLRFAGHIRPHKRPPLADISHC